MKVKRILLVCVLALILMLSLAACDDKTPADKPLPEHEHKIIAVDPIPATCKSSGFTSGAYCIECGEVLVQPKMVDKLDHTVVIDEAVEATCTKSGLTAGEHCSECGEIIVAQKIIPTNPHNFEDRVCKDCAAIYYSTGFTYSPNGNGTCAIIGIGSCTDTIVYIPEYIDGYKVVSIENWAFDYCSSLTSVVIPDSVTSIGNGTFYDCSSLTSVVIPDSVTSIGYYAFDACSSLVYNEYDNAYYLGNDSNPYLVLIKPKNTYISSCTINSNTRLIYPYAFYECISLTSIVIPDSVMYIGEDAFHWCYNLESITVEEGNTVYHSAGNCLIETATKMLIVGCKNSVIPADGSVTIIGDSAFDDCHDLMNIVIPEGVTSIGKLAFQNCGFSNIVIPDSVTSIESGAFFGCSSLTSIVIPDSVMYIGESAFARCSNLESITVEEGNDVYHIAGNCLIETASKTLIAGFKNSVIPADGSVTRIGDYAFEGCISLTSVVIPDSVTSIGDYAFYDCRSLTSIVIPDCVTSIGYSAFIWCDNLESITVEEGNDVYHSSANCLIETASKILMAGCNNSVIPTDGSVTSIGDRALSWRGSLTSIVIPDSVTNIGKEAFRGCRRLTSITFTGTVQQWNDIIKDYSWNDGVPATEVVCSNGTVTL